MCAEIDFSIDFKLNNIALKFKRTLNSKKKKKF
jgi:hypothetical protein